MKLSRLFLLPLLLGIFVLPAQAKEPAKNKISKQDRKGFYWLRIDNKKGLMYLSFRRHLRDIEMRAGDVITFRGDPKKLFNKEDADAIYAARPDGAEGAIQFGMINQGGQAGLNRFLDGAGFGFGVFGFCGGGGLPAGGKTQEITFSEPCSGGGGDGGAAFCTGSSAPSTGGASDAFASAFLGPRTGGGKAMEGESAPVVPESGATTYVSYAYDDDPTTKAVETSTSVATLRVDAEGNYVLDMEEYDRGGDLIAGTTYHEEGNIASTLDHTFDLLYDIADRAREERWRDRQKLSDGTVVQGRPEGFVVHNPQGSLQHPQCDSAMGDDCGNGEFTVAFRFTPRSQVNPGAPKSTQQPNRDRGEVSDCRDATGESCGGRVGGHQQPGVVTVEGRGGQRGRNLVNPGSPDDVRRGGGGPSGGGFLCSPDNSIAFVPFGYALDCDMRSMGGCDSKKGYDKAKGKMTDEQSQQVEQRARQVDETVNQRLQRGR